MSLPEPRANPELFGHAAAEAMLADAMRAGRLHHAWLITGPEGIGKATFAFRFARRLLAGVPAGNSLALAPDHPIFRRVAASSHADLLTVERAWDEKRKRLRGEIIVEHVRAVSGFLHRTAAEGGWRVVVIDGCENLNRNASNALLKMLEEPPPRAILLLVASSIGSLPPTIASRCRRLMLAPLNDGAMQQVVSRLLPDIDDAARARLIALADGSPGRAVMLAESGGLGAADLVDKVLTAPDRGTVLHAHAIADALGRDDTAFATFMTLLRAAIAAAVRDAAAGRADPDQARLLGTRRLDAWVEVWETLGQLQDHTEGAYLDKRQAVVTGLALLRAI